MSSVNRHLVVLGCGYVGSAVALQAVARGMRVTALTRNQAAASALAQHGIETVIADLAAEDWHNHIVGRGACVLNCVSSGGGGLDGYRHSYVGGMASILTWAKRERVETLLYTSSTSVYPQSGGVLVDEFAATTPPAHERAQLLLTTEENLRASGSAAERWFILRLAGIYGPGRHHFIDQVRAGQVGGCADVRLNLIHRDDVVSAIFAAVDAPRTIRDQVLNVVDDAPSRRGEVARWVAGQLALPPPHFSGEAGARREQTLDRVISNARIKATLGWLPRYSNVYAGYASLGIASAP